MATMTFLLLAAVTAIPSPADVADETPQRFVKEGDALVTPDLLCWSSRGLVYEVPGDQGPELRRLKGAAADDKEAARLRDQGMEALKNQQPKEATELFEKARLADPSQPGAVADRLALSKDEEQVEPPPGSGPGMDWDCGLGHCNREAKRVSSDGARTVSFQQNRSNYYQDWMAETRLTESGASEGWRARCPGGRPLIQCFTARRAVLVGVTGDVNDDPPGWGVEYVALSHDGKETLHLGKGKITHTGTVYRVVFSNRGFQYTLEANTAPDSASATLHVAKGGKPVQDEACLGFSVYPKHLDWSAEHK